MSTDRDPKLGLVLSGGGARGAFEAGVAEVIDEIGLRPGVVSGTSAGAITGAGVACGWAPERITRLWTSIQTRDVMRPRFDLHNLVKLGPLLKPPHRILGFGEGSTSETLLDVLGWTWFFHLEPLRELLVEELGGEELPLDDDVTLTLSAIEVATGRLVRFSNKPLPDGDRDGGDNIVCDLTVDHVIASAAIPGLFRPVELDGTEYWDGGLTSNTPLEAALTHEIDRGIVVGASTANPEPIPPKTLGDVLALALDHLVRASMLQDVDHARTVTELAEEAPEATRHRPVDLCLVLPDSPIEGLADLLDFEPSVAEELVEDGRRIARRQLQDVAWA